MQPVLLSAFDYELPPAAIALAPVAPRDHSRLLRVPPVGPFVDSAMRALPEALQAGDVLLVNTSKVVPARLLLRRKTGAQIECLVLSPCGGDVAGASAWRAMVRNAQSVRDGEILTTDHGAPVTLHRSAAGDVTLHTRGALLAVLEAEGQVPLPPYIRKQRDVQHAPADAQHQDATDYQSVFARTPGAVAAPTASLHFTETLLGALRARGVVIAEVCLHVGAGTFAPVRQEHASDVRAHVMHHESYDIPPDTQQCVIAALSAGRRVVPVGTTCLRAIETWADTGVATGQSDLFILPGYAFRVAGALLTNFHVPRSTLLMLVAAMAGRERMLAAYAHALANGYRFLSYGDAMWVHNPQAPVGLSAAIRQHRKDF